MSHGWTSGHFVGGHLALDFANTIYRRLPTPGPELLKDSAVFGDWLRITGVLDREAEDPPLRAVAEAIELRAALWTGFEALRAGRGVGPKVLEGVLGHAHGGARWVAVDDLGAVRGLDVKGATAALAVSSLQLLLAPPGERLRACDACGWFFLDRSKGGRRRWCSMKTCGNSRKVARYRAANTLPTDHA